MANLTIITGNITRDPDVRNIEANGRQTCVVNFTIATSRFFKRQSGERDKETTFVPCEAWDTGAETIGKIFKKGDPIYVEGALKEERWETEDGSKRSRLKVRVSKFEKQFRAPPRQETQEDDTTGVDEASTPF